MHERGNTESVLSFEDDYGHPYWTAPRDVWLAVGAPRRIPPYPCRCVKGQRCQTRGENTCPCRGRVDGDMMPDHCCAATVAA